MFIESERMRSEKILWRLKFKTVAIGNEIELYYLQDFVGSLFFTKASENKCYRMD